MLYCSIKHIVDTTKEEQRMSEMSTLVKGPNITSGPKFFLNIRKRENILTQQDCLSLSRTGIRQTDWRYVHNLRVIGHVEERHT